MTTEANPTRLRHSDVVDAGPVERTVEVGKASDRGGSEGPAGTRAKPGDRVAKPPAAEGRSATKFLTRYTGYPDV